ncbi:MAG: hypothetical protein RJA98_1079 [Pseudomonadota bacterium]|jgi:uncharacterized protein (TIGR02217 family)
MSNALFPTLPGLAWDVRRIPVHSTTVKTAVSGREYRARNMAAPTYLYKLSYEFLRADASDELNTLLGFYNRHGGQFDDWLFDDPDDRLVQDQVFAVADGASQRYQLVRTQGGNTEPVYAPAGIPTVIVNGVATTAFTLAANGVIVFNAPPTAGAVLKWAGYFYWRCRFTTDQLEFSKFLHQLWTAKSVEFKTIKP